MGEIKLNMYLRMLFDDFNKHNIKYCVIRDFFDENEINQSSDVDVSISIQDKKRVEEIFGLLGWISPKINLNTYSHKQYYKVTNGMCKKVDVIWGLYFSDGKYLYCNINKLYDNAIFLNGIKIPNYDDALLILLFHIVLDKKKLSDKNRRNLQRLLLYSTNQEVSLLAHKLLMNENNFSLIKERMFSMKLLYCRNNIIWRFYRRFRCKLYEIKYRQVKIAVIGVDGTGKSSLLKMVKEKYSEKVCIVYMGFKDVNNPRALNLLREKKLAWFPGIEGIRYYLGYSYEMKSRIKRGLKSKKKIIVYDRYSWEGYDNADFGYRKLFAYIFFKLIIPKPNLIIYLYCPIKISLLRKNDIPNIKEFGLMKKRFDNIYKKKSTCCIDTSISSREEVLDKMIELVIKFTGEQFY